MYFEQQMTPQQISKMQDAVWNKHWYLLH